MSFSILEVCIVSSSSLTKAQLLELFSKILFSKTFPLLASIYLNLSHLSTLLNMIPRPHAPAEASSVPSQAEYMICKICLISLLIHVHCVQYYNPLIPFRCTPVKAVILRFMDVAVISPS